MKGRRKRKFVLCLHRSNYQPESKCHWFHLLLHSCRSQEEEDEEEQQTNTDPVDTGQTIILRAGVTGSTTPTTTSPKNTTDKIIHPHGALLPHNVRT